MGFVDYEPYASFELVGSAYLCRFAVGFVQVEVDRDGLRRGICCCGFVMVGFVE